MTEIMSGPLEKILQRLVELHRGLIEVLEQEYVCLGNVDVSGMGELAHSKEIILGEILKQESARIEAATALLLQLGGAVLPPESENTSLQNVLVLLERRGLQDEGSRLRDLGETLRLQLDRARELNAKNLIFTESSLQRVELMKNNILGLTNTGIKENYLQTGARQPVTEQGGRLLSTKA